MKLPFIKYLHFDLWVTTVQMTIFIRNNSELQELYTRTNKCSTIVHRAWAYILNTHVGLLFVILMREMKSELYLA